MMKLLTSQPSAKRSSRQAAVGWRVLGAVALAEVGLGLSGCVDDGYGGVDGYYAAGPWSYDGWYDGFYGPIYDGYWGSDGAFYYRGSEGDHAFHRGGGAHFRHDSPGGSNHFQRFQGQGQPMPGMHAPHFPRGGGMPHGAGGHP